MNVRVRSLRRDDETALATFFETVSRDESTAAFFHPHALDHAAARRICRGEGISIDQYFVAVDDCGDIAAYGMLRGWDEGFEVPSFGVCVLPDRRGQGLGSLMLDCAIDRARDAGAVQLMLKVHTENDAAIRLYRSRGFELVPGDENQWIGHLRLGGSSNGTPD
jgi:ribosomal-protein-alanine N-acetyltransferase